MKQIPNLEQLLQSNPMAMAEEAQVAEIAKQITALKLLGLFAPRYDLASPFGGKSTLLRLGARAVR